MFSRQFPESLPMEVGPTIDPISMDSHDSMHASDAILRKGNDGNEDIPLLPRQTKVLVVGNNRTKAAHIGLHGVVKKSVGLGGWHWLVLENGQEVRLQRNALNVIEIGPREDQVCELASNLPPCPEYDPYLVKAEMSSEDEDTIPEGGPGSGPMDKTRPKRCPKPRQPYDGEGRPQTAHIHQTRVNFRKLDTVALQRYSKHYGLEDIGPNSSKEQLASAVLQHFESQDVDEASVIAAFMQAVRKVQHRNHRKPSHHFKPRLPRHSLPCA